MRMMSKMGLEIRRKLQPISMSEVARLENFKNPVYKMTISIMAQIPTVEMYCKQIGNFIPCHYLFPKPFDRFSF